MDAIYATDDYPREGCTLTVDIRNGGYVLRVFSPCGKMMEGYASVNTPRAIGRMVEEWASGLVPRIHGRLDDSPVSPFEEAA